MAKIPEFSHFFNQHDSPLGRHVNAASRKSFEIQAQSITKPRIHEISEGSRVLYFEF